MHSDEVLGLQNEAPNFEKKIFIKPYFRSTKFGIQFRYIRAYRLTEILESLKQQKMIISGDPPLTIYGFFCPLASWKKYVLLLYRIGF